jgi:hypothetical protein
MVKAVAARKSKPLVGLAKTALSCARQRLAAAHHRGSPSINLVRNAHRVPVAPEEYHLCGSASAGIAQ